MLSIKNMSFSYNGEDYVIDDCSAKFPARSNYIINGDNGSGKSTLMDILAGFKKPQKGSVLYNRVDMYKSEKHLQALRKTMSYMPSTLRLPPHLDVKYLVSMWMGSFYKEELTAMLGLGYFMDYRYSELSDGYRHRLHLAITLSKGSFVLLDEPLKSQDELLASIFPALLEVCSKGRTVIVSSPIFIDNVAWHKEFSLKEGKLIC